MGGELTAILLVEDDPAYARLIRTTLRRATSRLFELVHVTQLADALIQVKQKPFDAILLDLTLPDARGLETFQRLHRIVPEVPIVVLSGHDDEQLALSAVQNGAQDYLVKSQTDMRELAHAIAYAVERQRVQLERSRHITQLGILRDVDEELNRRLDLDYVLTMALDTAVRLGMANAGLIGLLAESTVQQMKSINYDLAKLPASDLMERGVVGRCLRERRPQRVLDVRTDPDYVALLPNTRAQVAIPLLSQDRLVGFLNLESTDPARFTEETFDFLKLLAARIGTAVDNARLYETAQSQVGQLQILYNQVRDLEQIKTDIIRVATHDLRTPINNVLGFAHLLRRILGTGADPQVYEFLDYIEQSTRRMQMITNDILSLERLDANGDLHSELVDLSDLTRRAYQEYEEEARQRNITYSLSVKDRPVSVQAEPALLYEAIANLIGNAIKYTPEGGSVTVTLTSSDTAAIFQVADTGYGIPKDQQEHIFQPFFRAHSEAVEGIDGTGLGLHLVRNIITRHAGEMVFESEYGRGSTFGFRLPLADAGAPAVA
jgi:signal transduction histidine kinase